MSSGTAKRPLDPRSRGNSPTGKRSRPLQTKNTTTAPSSRIQSPPSSRKPSSGGLSIQVPETLKLVSDRTRPVDSAHAKEHPQENPGRGDQASRQASLPHANVAQYKDKTPNDKHPSMQSLRKLQDRRRAIAAKASSTNGLTSATTPLEAKLKAQQIEISQLRKERDEFEKRLAKMENLLENLSRSANEQQHQQQDYSKDLQSLSTRLTALEDSSSASEAHKTATGSLEKTLALENEIIVLKRSQESQKNEITALNVWKASQTKTVTDDLAKLATDKAMEKSEQVKALMRKEMADISNRLRNVESDLDRTKPKVETIEDSLQTSNEHSRRIKELEDDMDRCLDFRHDVRQTELPNLQQAHENIDYRLRRLERAEQGSESNRSSTPTIASASVNTIARIVEELARDFKSFQHIQKESRDVGSKLTDVVERLDNIEQNLQGLEALKDHVVLDKSLEASLTGLHQRILSEIHSLQTDLDSKITDIQQHWSNVQSDNIPAREEDSNSALATTTTALLAHVNDIQAELDSLSDDFNEAGQKIHEHSATIAVIRDQVPELFRQQFDPFADTVKEQFGTVTSRIDAYASVLEGLRNEFANTHTATAQALTTKADIQAMAKQVDSITFALKDLEHRYQNISTEEMHQRMVHWFVQMYPTSAALMKDTAQLQQDVNELKVFCNQIAWVRSRTGILRDLCKYGTQLQAIAQQYSPQNQTKIELAVYEAQTGLLQAQQSAKEAQEQVSQITQQIADMQTAAYQHRRDFDTMKDTLIEPNRDFFGLFGTVLTVLSQLQQAAESLNQNLPGTPLKLDWECYLPSLVERSKAGNGKETGGSKE